MLRHVSALIVGQFLVLKPGDGVELVCITM